MNDRRVPVPKKWPFYVADALLLAFAVWIVSHYPHPLSFGTACLMGGCVIFAAFLGVMPYRMEHQAAVKFAEADGLADTMSTLRKLETLTEQVRMATGQWQGVQEQAGRTVTASKEIADRIAAEAHSFAEFMQKANDSEKAALRLEVEKLRRGEGQWLQVLVHLLDHVFALYQAGARSGQSNLQEQLAHFQEACRDIARRVGLLPFEAAPSEAFDAERHQVSDDQPAPPPDARVAQTLATGYTFQGRLLRRSLVVVHTEGSALTAMEEIPAASASSDSSSVELDSFQMADPVEDASDSSAASSSFEAPGEFRQPVGTQAQPEPTLEEQEFRLEAESLDSRPSDDRRRA